MTGPRGACVAKRRSRSDAPRSETRPLPEGRFEAPQGSKLSKEWKTTPILGEKLVKNVGGGNGRMVQIPRMRPGRCSYMPYRPPRGLTRKPS
jgi:hypothetical protein